MIIFYAGFVCGGTAIGLIWAIKETIRRAKKPPHHVIYRKGQLPEIILR